MKKKTKSDLHCKVLVIRWRMILLCFNSNSLKDNGQNAAIYESLVEPAKQALIKEKHFKCQMCGKARCCS
jgi:hypothetical protein